MINATKTSFTEQPTARRQGAAMVKLLETQTRDPSLIAAARAASGQTAKYESSRSSGLLRSTQRKDDRPMHS